MSLETDRIEADLDASRHRLNDTLGALGSKLSPGQMLDEALGLAQGQAGQFASKLGRQVRDNPLPTVLIGAGIAMLMMHNRREGQSGLSNEDWEHDHRYRSLEEARWATPRMSNETDDAYEDRVHQVYAETLDLKQKAGEAVHEFKGRVKQTVAGITERAKSARERTMHGVSDAKHATMQGVAGAARYTKAQAQKLGQNANEARHRAEHLYQDNPLAAGAIAMAVGALVGSTAPLSDPERRSLRGVADRAAQTGADLAERGKRLVDDGLDQLH